MLNRSIRCEKGEETEHSKQSFYVKKPRKPKKPRNPKYFIQVVFTIDSPFNVRNKSRYVINISYVEMYGNNSFPILFIIIVKRGNIMRNVEDNIVKWL